MAARKVDLSEFDALVRKSAPTVCKVEQRLSELPESDRDNADVALADAERYSNALIARWFQSKGLTVGSETIGKHRRGECSCARA